MDQPGKTAQTEKDDNDLLLVIDKALREKGSAVPKPTLQHVVFCVNNWMGREAEREG